MALEQLSVCEIVRRAVSKNVDIPEFQREFVWEPEKVKFLAESLYRDYPIGSFLLWDSSEYQEARTAQGSRASLWIVDGQQRTTALCLLLKMKPYWWPDARDWNRALQRYDVMVNLLPDGDDGWLKFALPNPIRRRDPRWIGVRRVLSTDKVEDLTPLADEIVGQLSDDPAQTKKLFGKVHPRLIRLWQIRQRNVPAIKIDHEVEDVAEIFARLNQAGTRLKEADVVLALAAVRNPGWVRNDYLPYRGDLEDRGWDLDAGIFVRTMTGIGYARARLKEVPGIFWDPDNLPSAWKNTKAAISGTVKRIAEFGILSDSLLPSTNSLIPLFVLHHRWGPKPDYRFSRALRWFLLANRDGRYSGSAITTLNEDVRAITEAKDFDNALANLLNRLQASPEIDEEEFLNRYDRAGNRFLRLMLYLVLYHRKAPDWVDGTRLGYDNTGSPITMGFQPQWHHIYPRSMLKRAGETNDVVHALANITVLNERTNVNKLAGKAPWRYLQQFDISPEVLRTHYIPESFAQAVGNEALLKDRWSTDKYTDFLIERALSLAQEANAFLQNLEG